MGDSASPSILTESITRDTAVKTEWSFHDENGQPIHISKRLLKNKSVIYIFPYNYSDRRGLSKKKISEIELRGWAKFEDIPKLIRKGSRVKITGGEVGHLMRFIKRQFPKVRKIKFLRTGRNRFGKKQITFNWSAFANAVSVIRRETDTYSSRRKAAINNTLAEITSKLKPKKAPLKRGQISRHFSLHDTDVSLSNADLDAILAILASAPASRISVTENFIQTKDKMNVAYLDDVIAGFEALLKATGDNEKKWQAFFEKHAWILANLFPFQVVLHGKEAYVGGKGLHNKQGRVVDFLYQNGFRDNYALLETKTHLKKLLQNKPYRPPDVYAMHGHLTAAISQCLDQKNTFLTDFGQKYKVLDPRVVLVIGQKSRLDVHQAKCFELIRGNQRNVELVTFDELLEKIKGLRSILGR